MKKNRQEENKQTNHLIQTEKKHKKTKLERQKAIDKTQLYTGRKITKQGRQELNKPKN